MKAKTIAILLVSHLFIGLIGFAVGIYSLPILTAPKSPSEANLAALSKDSLYSAQFTRQLTGSDFLHWGDGEVSLTNTHIVFNGELSPGPDFKLYLSPKFVESEVEFEKLKSSMIVIGDVNTFSNFVVTMPANVDLAKYNTVIVWCESFGEFITAAKYR